jgi:hypothetical protein
LADTAATVSAAARPRARTFVDWGVGVPFTTPSLAQSRVRPGRRGKAELILPSLGGARGFYVIDLASTPELTTLTVHDRLLLERLLALAAITPSDVRRVARTLAMEGAAGRRAARAARASSEAEQQSTLLMRFYLVTRLLRQAGLPAIDWQKYLHSGDQDARGMIREVLQVLAQRLGTSGEHLFDRLEEASRVAASVGPPLPETVARNETLIASIEAATRSLRQWRSPGRAIARSARPWWRSVPPAS